MKKLILYIVVLIFIQIGIGGVPMLYDSLKSNEILITSQKKLKKNKLLCTDSRLRLDSEKDSIYHPDFEKLSSGGKTIVELFYDLDCIDLKKIDTVIISIAPFHLYSQDVFLANIQLNGILPYQSKILNTAKDFDDKAYTWNTAFLRYAIWNYKRVFFKIVPKSFNYGKGIIDDPYRKEFIVDGFRKNRLPERNFELNDISRTNTFYLEKTIQKLKKKGVGYIAFINAPVHIDIGHDIPNDDLYEYMRKDLETLGLDKVGIYKMINCIDCYPKEPTHLKLDWRSAVLAEFLKDKRTAFICDTLELN